MSKYKASEPKEGEVFMASVDAPNTDKLFNVMFKENRSFEVAVLRETLRFEPHVMNPVSPEQYRNGVPESVIISPQFQLQKKYFTVIEKA